MFEADNGRQLIAWRRRLHLIFCGYSEAEISQLGDLTKITNERMNELIHSNKLESTEKVGEELKQNSTSRTRGSHRWTCCSQCLPHRAPAPSTINRKVTPNWLSQINRRGTVTDYKAISTTIRQLFHNYIRPHVALDGRTPAEAAAIQVNGKTSGLH